jgi:hypothetical protein
MLKKLLYLAIALTMCWQSGWTQSQARPALVSLRAEMEMTVVTTLSDGNKLERSTSAMFFRDERGRTRIEQGDTVTINDPVSHFIYVLDLRDKTARRFFFKSDAKRVETDKESSRLVSNENGQNKLGTKSIDGMVAIGEEHVSVTPANSRLGNKQPITKITRIWHSEELQLPILTSIEDPLSGTFTAHYKNIQKHLALDPSLFVIPPDFEVSTLQSAPGQTANGQQTQEGIATFASH